LAYSIVDTNSFENIKHKWHPEINHYAPNVPFVLVATKLDMRENEDAKEYLAAKGRRMVTTKEGEALAKELGAAQFIECSALTKENLNNVFEGAIRSVFEKERKGGKRKGKRRHRCNIM